MSHQQILRHWTPKTSRNQLEASGRPLPPPSVRQAAPDPASAAPAGCGASSQSIANCFSTGQRGGEICTQGMAIVGEKDSTAHEIKNTSDGVLLQVHDGVPEGGSPMELVSVV
jgi:hypothetical protein